MDKTIQIYDTPAGGMYAGWQPGMADNAICRNNEPCYVTFGGETFYIGNEGKPMKKKRRNIFCRIFRHMTHKEETAWKKAIA